MSRQSRFDAQYWMLGAGALGLPRGVVWGGRREEGSGWGTHVCLWWIHFDIWQNQYNIVKFKNKIKLKKKKNPPVNAGDTGDSNSIPGSGRSPGEGKGNPLQYSCLENPMDRGYKTEPLTRSLVHFHTNVMKAPFILSPS